MKLHLTQEDIESIYNQLLMHAKNRDGGGNIPEEFLVEYPCFRKYLSHFNEADSLEKIALAGARVVPISDGRLERLNAALKLNGKPERIGFRITLEDNSNNLRSFTFFHSKSEYGGNTYELNIA